MSDLVRFELSGVPCAISLGAVARIEAADGESLDLAQALGIGALGPLGDHERALRMSSGGPALRVGAALRFEEALGGEVGELPLLARGHPWVTGVLVREGEAPVLRLAPALEVGE